MRIPTHIEYPLSFFALFPSFFLFFFDVAFSSMSAFFFYSPTSFFFSLLVRSSQLVIFPTRSFFVFASSLLLRFLRRSFSLARRTALSFLKFFSLFFRVFAFFLDLLPTHPDLLCWNERRFFVRRPRQIDRSLSLDGRSIASTDRLARSPCSIAHDSLLFIPSVNVSNDSNRIAVKALRYRDRWSIGIVFTRKPRN